MAKVTLKFARALVAGICLICASAAMAQDSVNGFAAVAGQGLATTTGGGNATPQTVATFAQLSSAVSGSTPRVIIVSGTINTTDGGGSALKVGANKTLIGADKNATIYGGLELANNTIVRNLNLQGTYPNSGPDDVLHVQGVHHVWIDHCNIWDGTDGNLDITDQANYVTVSWCKFWYTDPNHPHALCSLIGSGGGDHPEDWGYLKVTFHHNWFAQNVDSRMPRLMYGQAHVYNDYYTSSGNGYCIGVGSYGSALVENNYFKSVSDPHGFMYDVYCYIVARGNTYVSTSGAKDSGLGGSRDVVGQESFDVQPFNTPPYLYALDGAANIPSIVTNFVGPQDPSPVPTGLAAAPGQALVWLTWSGALNATNYIVKRSTVNGGPYTNIATNSTTSFTNSGLANGTTYYYVVSALNSLGETTNSDQASATPLIAVPTDLAATAGNAQVSLSWTASFGATGYAIKRATVNGGPYTSIATNATTTYTNTGLVNNTTYYYVLAALTATGESANTPQVSATPQIFGPTGLVATAGNAQISLTWSASAGATNYIVKRATVNGGPYTSIVTNATTTYMNLGLANNTTYYFVVSALSAGGESGNSSQVSAMPADGSSITVVDAPSAVVTGSSATTVTTPVTVSPGANCLVVLINNMKETATGGWMVTWNGQTLANAVVLQSGSTGAKSAVYYLYNPATDGAPHDLAVTFTAGATAYHIQYFTLAGVDTAVAPLTGSTNNSGTAQTFNISGCPQNGLAALNAVNSSSSGTTTALTSFGSGVLTATNITGNSPSCSIGYANLIAAGTDTFTATSSVSGKFAFTAAVFAPAGSAPANTVPSLPSISNRTINVGYNLSITNTAMDSDVPAQILTYSLTGKPQYATFDTNSGIFNWRPQVTQANTTNAMTVVVTDNGTPSLSATQTFKVVVNALTLPVITAAPMTNGQVGLTVNGQVGPDYAVQGSTNLVDWQTLLITNPALMPFSWSTNTGVLPSQFYRIKIGPPLP